MKHPALVYNYLFTFLITLSCLLGSTSTSYASHALGAEVTYEHLGGNDYNFKLILYRDCNGIGAPSTPSINLSSISCGQQFSLSLVQASFREVSLLCPATIPSSTCNGGPIQGVEEHVYEFQTTLPANCADWIASYSVCCRNAIITTVPNSQNYDLYVQTELNNLDYPDNNSPQFVNVPIFYACAGQQVH